MGVAGHLNEGPYVDPRRRHIDDEVRDAFVFWRVDIGTSQENPVVGELAERRPYLLTIDDPFVAITLSTRCEGGEVTACSWFGEELAPQLLSSQHRGEVHLLFWRPMTHEGRRHHPQRNSKRTEGFVDAGHLLVEYRRMNDGFAPAPERFGPRNSRPTVFVQRSLPGQGLSYVIGQDPSVDAGALRRSVRE